MSNGIELEYYNHHHPRVIDETGEGMLGDGFGEQGADPEPPAVFTETDLTLVCLDYLRDLRRSYPSDVLEEQEGIKGDYLTLACWALNRALSGAPTLTDAQGKTENDCFFHPRHVKSRAPKATVRHQHIIGTMSLPTSMEEIEKEILYAGNPLSDNEDQKKEEDQEMSWYEYDDQHSSNVHRFYPLGGLASGPSWPGPLTLGEMATAACTTLKAKTRLQAEQELIQSELFDQFVQAVQEKGFFEMDSSIDPSDEKAREMHYEERFRKVVAKFRVKMASREEMTGDRHPADLDALQALEDYQRKREVRIHEAHELHQQWLRTRPRNNDNDGEKLSDLKSALSPRSLQERGETSSNVGTEASAASYVNRLAFAQRILSMAANEVKKDGDKDASATGGENNNPADLAEAERLKTKGNTYMQKKEYQAAADSYTSALKLSPAGPQSHVYFSNRAAALVSLRKFHEAILDSERSLSLKPDYGKAHARLGLAHFLLGNYQQATEAYTVALKYEPENKASKSYLDKAAKRLAESGGPKPPTASADVTMSFSAVSEFGKISNFKKERFEKQRAEKEAERLKNAGNTFMGNRDYGNALDAYNEALKLSSQGPQSHVYYSNRAAALCYLERYEEAEADSLKSLELEPKYGKAHARLGLSRFFLRKFLGAAEAYTLALIYDPDNSASKSYLAKAKAMLTDEELNMLQLQKAKHLIGDKTLQAVAAKALTGSSQDLKDLFDDPEMVKLTKQAMQAMRK
eukprot:scaffold8374_cov175-Amphora_coffeaeformis.AAC.68